MTKKIVSVCFLVLFASMLFASALNVKAESFPTSIHLAWNAVDGATYYDIYNGQTAVARLDRNAREYTVTRLISDSEFNLCVAARRSDNSDITSRWVKAKTGSWDGVYRWTNLTRDNMRGRMTELVIRLETAFDQTYGQYYNVYQINGDEEYRIFPLFPLGSPLSGTWVDYHDNSEAGTAYRINAEKFNKSPFTPSRWRVDRIMIDYDSTSAYIQTSAFGINVTTETTFNLYIEDGVKTMSFNTEASGIGKGMIFKNPNPGEGEAFILKAE